MVMNNNLLKILTLVLAMLSSHLGMASENKWIDYTYFNNITMPAESNATMVVSIAQDNRGIIWVGTDCGVFSYDGYSMRFHSQRVCGDHIYCIFT